MPLRRGTAPDRRPTADLHRRLERMGTHRQPQRTWYQTLATFTQPRVVAMLLLGFSAGIPLLLIFSSLSLWLREAGVERAAVTFFSWAALGYSFKFVWAPLIDRLPVPLLTRRLGRRRAWLLVAQGAVITAILWMAHTDPAQGQGSLVAMALGAVLLGFSSATQDIVIDAYRIESADTDLQAMLSSAYVAGYRVGMLTAGAGALFLAGWFGTELGAYSHSAWKWTYVIMAALMSIGIASTLLFPEPERSRDGGAQRRARGYLGFVVVFALAAAAFASGFFLSAGAAADLKARAAAQWGQENLTGFLIEAARLGLALLVAVAVSWAAAAAGVVNRELLGVTYMEPVRDFFSRYGVSTAWLLLALVGVYRISDIVLGVISNVFYQDLGFSKEQIATVVKGFGLAMTLLGGFLGGVLAARHGVMRILFLGALLSAGTNLLFLLLAHAGRDASILYLVIAADNLSAGLASVAFVAFLSSLTNIAFTAVQYAVFSSLMTLLPKLLGGYSGTLVEAFGYSGFFVLTTLLGLPVLVLVWLSQRRLTVGGT
jgi:PAT family beta-lactamase induction signal transducer AmpG